MRSDSLRRARLLAAAGGLVGLLVLAGAPAAAAAPPPTSASASTSPHTSAPASGSALAAAPASGSTTPSTAARRPMPLDQQLFGEVEIPAGAVVREDIQMVAGTVRVDGHLTGSVSLTAGQVEVGPAGRIDGSVALAMGQVTVRPGGSIGGSIVVSGQTPRTGLTCPRRGADCALVGGSPQSGQTAPWRAFTHRYPGGLHLFRGLAPWIGWLRFGFHVLSWLGMLALAIPVTALWPGAIAATALQMRRDPGRSALVGLAAGVLALPALAVVAITIIGLPVAFAAAAGLVAVWFFGSVALWQLVGNATLARAGRGEPHPLLALGAGSVLLFLAGWIPLLGGLVWLTASCLGVGATLLTRFGTGTPWFRRGGTAPPAA